MILSRLWKRRIPLWLTTVIMVASIVSTAAALTIYMLTIEEIDLWGGQYQHTKFTVTSFETKIKGKNKVEITLTLKNTGSQTHSATVTMQLLESNGDVILESEANTGDISGGDSWTYKFTFYQKDLVSQYDQPFLVIEQTS